MRLMDSRSDHGHTELVGGVMGMGSWAWPLGLDPLSQHPPVKASGDSPHKLPWPSIIPESVKWLQHGLVERWGPQRLRIPDLKFIKFRPVNPSPAWLTSRTGCEEQIKWQKCKHKKKPQKCCTVRRQHTPHPKHKFKFRWGWQAETSQTQQNGEEASLLLVSRPPR